jgi:hypothetical protein
MDAALHPVDTLVEKYAADHTLLERYYSTPGFEPDLAHNWEVDRWFGTVAGQGMRKGALRASGRLAELLLGCVLLPMSVEKLRGVTILTEVYCALRWATLDCLAEPVELHAMLRGIVEVIYAIMAAF